MVQLRENVLTGVSWAGAFAGLLVGVFSYLVLMMLGVAIGGATFSTDLLGEMAWGALIWLAISAGIAAFLAGFTASRFAPGITTNRAGLYTGILTGTLLVMTLTMLALNSATAIVGAGFSSVRAIAGGAGQVVGAAPQEAAQSVGLQEEFQILSGGVDRAEIEKLIAERSPNLNQTQARAASEEVVALMGSARQEIVSSLRTPNRIGDVVTQQFDRIQKEVSGPQFTQRLQQRGLSGPDAQEVTNTVRQRIDELRNQATSAVKTVQTRAAEFSEQAAGIASRAAWTWLVVALVILGLSTLGGSRGTNERDLEDYEEFEQRRERHEDEIRAHHH